MPRLAESASDSGHALDAYAAFLRTQPQGQRGQLYFARRFARLYPDLADWLSAPLDERVGSTIVRQGAAWAVASARPYIYFLVSLGRIELDWAWVIAINDHRHVGAYLSPAVAALEQRLTDRLEELGYRRAGERVRRAVRYFYLRYGEGVLALTGRHFDELATAWHDLAGRDDLGSGFDEMLMHRRQATLRSACFATHLALYHEGLMPTPPRRTRFQQTAHRVKPAMAGLLRRYREIREATDARPTTAVRYEAYGRHFADWLWDHHSDVHSFADLTRQHILGYAKSLVD